MEESRTQHGKKLGILLFCLIWCHAALCLPILDNTNIVLEFAVQKDNTSEEPTAFDRPALSGVDLDITSDLGFDASEIDPKQSADLIVTQDALELIEVMQQVRPKYDENRPDLASREAHSVQSKGKEAEMSPEPLVPDDGFKDVRDALTSVLKKRADDDNEQSLVSSQQKALEKPSLENVFHLFTPPGVTVRTSLYSQPDDASQAIKVPLVPYMSVLRALIFAASNFKELNKDVENEHNPFNVALKWNDKKSCYVIIELLGQKSHGHEFWEIAVLSKDREIKYHDKCLPFEGELVLRPHDEVLLFHL